MPLQRGRRGTKERRQIADVHALDKDKVLFDALVCAITLSAAAHKHALSSVIVDS